MTTPTPPAAYQAAINALKADGLEEDAARAVLRVTPPEGLAVLSQRGLEAWADQETERAARAFAASPEGRQQEAQALIAAETEQEARLKEADAILRSRGIQQADLDHLDAETKLRVTGVVSVAPPRHQPKMHSNMIREEKASQEDLALLRQQDGGQS